MQTFPLEIDIQYKDLSDEDQALLARICQRKKELLQEIEGQGFEKGSLICIAWLSDSIFCVCSRRTLVIADNFDGNGILGTEGRYCVTKEDTYHVAEGQLSVAEGQYHGVIVPQALTDQQIRAEINDVTAEIESIDNSDQHDKNPKTQLVMIGRKKFNMDPKKGIEYLVERGLLQLTAEEVAQFLFKGEGLNKTAIGDYLGERHDFNIAVLKAFVTLNDFCGMILVQALRQFLWSFRLPGEAQKIDRMMECFAQRYCDQNPGMFKSTDTCYVLSFAIIMLNTSLHNPSVRDKPAVESFIKMNRGINEGGDLPRELLENLYNSIKNEPFKIPEDDGNDLMHTFFNPVKEGWLCKQGGRVKSWKRRWFILNDNCLYYFEFTTDKEPKGIIPLENVQVREIVHPHRPNCFEIHSNGSDFIKACKTDSDGKVVEGKHMVYKMSASSSDDREDWIRSIRASVSDNPFYDLLAARRRKATQL